MNRSTPSSRVVPSPLAAAVLRVAVITLSVIWASGCKAPDTAVAPASITADHAEEGGHDHAHPKGEHPEGEHAEGESKAAHADHPEPQSSHGASAGLTERIALPESARQTLGVVFAKAELRAVQRTQRIPGRIELRPGAVRTHHAPLSGPMTLTVGIMQHVEAGATLGTLRPPELRLDQDDLHRTKHDIEDAADQVRLAEARRVEADKTVARLSRRIRTLESASARKADLESDADAAKSREGVLDAELKAARSKLERERHHFEVKLQAFAERVGEPVATMDTIDAAGRARWEVVDAIELEATSAGRVTALPRGLSGWVAAGEALVEVTDATDWWFSGWALEADLPLVATISSAVIVPARGAPTDRRPISLRLGPGSQSPERRFQVLGEPVKGSGESSEPLPVWIRPGMSVFAEIVVAGTSEHEVAVPREAVVRDGDQTVVFRRDPTVSEQVIRQPVTVGADDGRWVALFDGVAPGDEVVTRGAYALKLASSGTERATGHMDADGTFHTGGH